VENKTQTHSELLELQDKLRNKHEYYLKQLEQVTADLNVVTRTLELLEDKGTRKQEEYPIVPPALLKDMTQLDALKAIARANNGKFYVKDAKRLLVAAGLIENPKNVSSIVHTLIDRSDAFHRVRRGLYRLVEEEDSPKILSAHDLEVRVIKAS
jgi:hypothetical protein